MNKIEEMIERLCPNGVEYKTLREVGSVTRGGNFQKKDFVEEGLPCIHYGQIYTLYGLHTDKTFSHVNDEVWAKSKKACPGDVIMAVTSENIEDVCKCVTWLGDEEVAISGHTAIIHHELYPKYLTYYFRSRAFEPYKRKLAHGTKVIEVTPAKLLDVAIPVPPMEIQEEIVRVLDSFAELAAELEAELEARKVQYAYYRDKLLDFSSRGGAALMPLSEVCVNVCSGGTPSRKNSSYYEGDVPWLKTQEVDYCDIYSTEEHISQEALNISSAKIIPANCVVVAMYGATAAKVAINKIPLSTNQACCNLQIDDTKASYRYVYHWISREYEKIKSLGEGSQSNLSGEKVKKYPISVPSLEEQERVVSILDKFDTLVNDISQGLPAEIEARRKQYEYYRDKLLTFKEKAA